MRLTPDWVGLCLKGGAVWKTSFGISTSHTNLMNYSMICLPNRLATRLSIGCEFESRSGYIRSCLTVVTKLCPSN